MNGGEWDQVRKREKVLEIIKEYREREICKEKIKESELIGGEWESKWEREGRREERG